MQHKEMKEALKIVLPILFIIYASCITFFTHTHIINGVTIVHSHPYSSDENGNPTHEHSGTEIQLIQTLSTFYIAGPIALAILAGLFSGKKVTLFTTPFLPPHSRSVKPLYRLRPPPAL